jgi:glutamate-ammonia-ligase adenylyltransferase
VPADPTLAPTIAAAVERCAAPAVVRRALAQLAETDPSLLPRDELSGIDTGELTEAEGALVAVLAASRSLTRLLLADRRSHDVLRQLGRRPPRADTTTAELVRWKQHELLRIAARDLIGLDSLETTTGLLADLAADVLHGATLLAEATDRGDGDRPGADGVLTLAVIGMGKLGGHELNYASDVDIMFVGDGHPDRLERRARAIIDIAGRCFRIDAGLRPEGRDGPLVRSLDSYEAYWDRWAQPWEFQALLKARPVAGDAKLGALFGDTAQRWLWSHPFSSDELRSLRQMKARAESEIARRGLTDREIKRGRGGIRDIEFTVQLLQLVHGHLDPDLRSPTTLTVLGEMADAGYVDGNDAKDLSDAYRFLRLIEHRLQLEDEQQVHTVPVDRDQLDRLARVAGFRDHGHASAADQLGRELLSHQLAVRAIHERVYFRPLLEAFADAESALNPDAAATRLSAFGFTDAARTRVAIQELTKGLNRSSRLMQQMLPLLLDWLSTAPDPDMGLLMLRNLLSGPQRTTQLLDAFRDSPDAAQRVCTLVGTSRILGDILVHHPDLVIRLPDESRLRTLPHDELVRRGDEAITWRADLHERQVGLRRWKDRNLLGIAARDVLSAADVDTVGQDLSALAEASIEVALTALEPAIPFCVLALGRLGGAELSYASDLDLVFVYDGGAREADEALRVASGLKRFLGGATPADQLYPVDTNLRPEGKQGPLARSVEAFVHYWERYALVWERQAMMRARPVAGDRQLGARLLDALDPFIWGDDLGRTNHDGGLSADDLTEIRRMKARIERERIPFGEDPQFHLKLGRGSLSDIEFTAQLLQLQHGVRAPGTMRALTLLAEAGALDRDDADVLTTSYRFCERTRNRWYLVNSKPGNSLPTRPEDLLTLARSLEVTPTDLREQYRRVTRRARRVVERVFYGQD